MATRVPTDLILIREAADLLGVSTQRVYQLTSPDGPLTRYEDEQGYFPDRVSRRDVERHQKARAKVKE